MTFAPRLALGLIAATFVAPAALADGHVGPRMVGALVTPGGTQVGSVSIFETASGVVRVNIQATQMTEGPHGVHLHEVGDCGDGGKAAGGHIAGDADHGLVEGGPHPGDLPNGFVQADGVLAMEALTDRIDVTADLMDADGSALVIHAGPDDYTSQPSGASGDRIACAVLEAS